MPNNNYELKTFTNTDYGKLSIIIVDNEFWFIGKTIAQMLGYERPNNAVNKYVESDDRKYFKKSDVESLLPQNEVLEIPNRGVTLINESGLYSLVLASKLPSARKFQRWVTSEVLPSIRKHGAYMTKEVIEQTLLNPDFIIKLATELKEEQEKNARLTEEKKYLETENAALTGEINLWSERSVINALVRKYSSVTRKSFEYGFRTYYRYLNTKLHINLKSRKTRSGKKNAKYFDFLKVNELKPAIGVAVAMCKEVGIDVIAVINAENAKQYL